MKTLLYRALSGLDAGKRGVIEQGAVFPAKVLPEENLAVLERLGRIAPCSAPPLGVLPGWKTRAGKLEAAGVNTAEEFIDANPDELAGKLEQKPERVRAWQRELLDLLKTPKPEG